MRGGDALALLEHTLAGEGPALLEALPKVEGSEAELTDELLNEIQNEIVMQSMLRLSKLLTWKDLKELKESSFDGIKVIIP